MSRTLGVVCDLCVVFIYIYLVHVKVIYAFVFIQGHSFLHANLLTVKKVRNLKVLRYYKGTGPHRQI